MATQVHAGGRRAVRRTQTRASILDAAQSVLVTRGYQGASVEEIATVADVAVGSIYTYFGSKDGLFRALVEKALVDDEAVMDAAHEGGEPAASLEAMREGLARLHRRNPAVTVLVLASICGAAPRDLTEPIVERTRAELARLKDLISAGVSSGALREIDAELAAMFLWAAWSGLTTLHLRSDDIGITDEAFDDVAEVGFRILATGLVQRPISNPKHPRRTGRKR